MCLPGALLTLTQSPKLHFLLAGPLQVLNNSANNKKKKSSWRRENTNLLEVFLFFSSFFTCLEKADDYHSPQSNCLKCTAFHNAYPSSVAMQTVFETRKGPFLFLSFLPIRERKISLQRTQLTLSDCLTSVMFLRTGSLLLNSVLIVRGL